MQTPKYTSLALDVELSANGVIFLVYDVWDDLEVLIYSFTGVLHSLLSFSTTANNDISKVY